MILGLNIIKSRMFQHLLAEERIHEHLKFQLTNSFANYSDSNIRVVNPAVVECILV
jgi:hypothetical protein